MPIAEVFVLKKQRPPAPSLFKRPYICGDLQDIDLPTLRAQAQHPRRTVLIITQTGADLANHFHLAYSIEPKSGPSPHLGLRRCTPFIGINAGRAGALSFIEVPVPKPLVFAKTSACRPFCRNKERLGAARPQLYARVYRASKFAFALRCKLSLFRYKQLAAPHAFTRRQPSCYAAIRSGAADNQRRTFAKIPVASAI